MGRKPDLSQEEQRLRQATREAHEAAQYLRDVIREANQLIPTLIEQFEKHHEKEMNQLSNHLIAESNRLNAQLNADIETARQIVNDQIMAGHAVFDVTTRTVTITWGPGRFNDTEPLPHPELTDRTTAP